MQRQRRPRQRPSVAAWRYPRPGVAGFLVTAALVGAVIGAGAAVLAEPEPQRSGRFRNCAQARAAGIAPIPRVSPDYRPELDADGDGIACENQTRRRKKRWGRS